MEQLLLERGKIKLPASGGDLLPVHLYSGVRWGYQADTGLLRNVDGSIDLRQIANVRVSDYLPEAPSQLIIKHPDPGAELVVQAAHAVFENFRITVGEALHIFLLVKRDGAAMLKARDLASKFGLLASVETMLKAVEQTIDELDRADPSLFPKHIPLDGLSRAWKEHALFLKMNHKLTESLLESVTTRGFYFIRRGVRMVRRARRGVETKRKIREESPRSRFVLAITGLEGSGKSTQAATLAKGLEASGETVAVVHQFEPTTKLFSVLKRKIKRGMLSVQSSLTRSGTTSSSVNSIVEESRSGPAVRVGHLFLAGWWLFGGYWRARRNWRRFSNSTILLLDRCYIDEIVRVEWKLGITSGIALSLLRRLPVPDLVIFLDVAEETSWERKKSSNVSRARYSQKRQILKDAVQSIEASWPVVKVTDESGDPSALARQITSLIGEQPRRH